MRMHPLVSSLALGVGVLALAACAQPADQVRYAPNDCAYFENNYGAHHAVDHFSKGSPVYVEGWVLACDNAG